MSKFCIRCGAEIEDDAQICTSCGENQGSSAPSVPEDLVEVSVENNGEKKNGAVFIAACAVVLVVVILIVKVMFGGSYTDPVDNLCKAMETGKGKYIYKCVPEFILEDQYADEKKSEIIEDLDDEGEDMLEYLEGFYGDDIKVRYKVKDKDEIKKKELKEVEEDIKDNYDVKVKVKKGYKLKLKLRIKGDDKSKTKEQTVKVYKIKGDWVLLDTSLI